MSATKPPSAHPYAETEDSLQLNLFSWDRVKVGEGLEALAALDFGRAAGIFQAVLSKWPGHPDASAGLTMATEWAAILNSTGTLPRPQAAAALWATTKSYAFGERGQSLRKEILRRAVGLLDGDTRRYVPPDLCLGRLLLELEDHAAAERALEQFLETNGPHAGMMISLGNCRFLQGRRTEARLAYAKAFLLVPWEVEREQIADRELLQAIADEDGYSAAVCGWLRRILPLIELEVGSAHDERHEECLRVYRAVIGAEKARAKRDHDAMVAERRLLKRLAPGVFLEYMGRMEIRATDHPRTRDESSARQ